MRPIKITLALTAATSLLGVAACGGGGGSSDPLASSSSTGSAAAGAPIVIASQVDFPENTLLAEIYAEALEAKGVKVTRKFNAGTRETYMKAFTGGSLDLVPEYTGAADRFLNPSTTAVGADNVVTDLKAHLPTGLAVLDPSKAVDSDTATVSKKFAAQHNLKTVGDLKSLSSSMVFGGPSEFKTRKTTGIPALQTNYGLVFKQFKAFSATKLTAQALIGNQIQAGNIFSSDPWFTTYPIVALTDTKGVFGSQVVIPMIRSSKNTAAVTAALNAVSAKLTTAGLSALNKSYSVDQKDVGVVAKQWLTDNALL